MSSADGRDRVSPARFIIAWLLVGLALLVAMPAIAHTVEALLPFPYHWKWSYFLNPWVVSHAAVGVLVFGLPAIGVFAAAWWVRSAKPPHPALFYALTVVSAGFFLTSRGWYIPITYLAIGGVLHFLRRPHRSVLLPRNAAELFLRLTDAFPEFPEYWKANVTPQAFGDRAPQFSDVFDVFCNFFRQHVGAADFIELARPHSLARLGVLLNDCVRLATPKLRDATADHFLRQLRNDPGFERLRPYLCANALEQLEPDEISAN